MTLYDLDRRFPDEESARAHLFRLRWRDGKVTCPRCGKPDKVYRRKAKAGETVSYKWICKDPEECKGYGFSLTTGTIFEDTKIPLRDWFRVLLLMVTSKKGMSALQIQRTVFGEALSLSTGKKRNRGSYETTWYMCHRLRAAMKSHDFANLMGVEVVCDTLDELDRLIERYGTDGADGAGGSSMVRLPDQRDNRREAKLLRAFVKNPGGLESSTVQGILGVQGKAIRGALRDWAKQSGLPPDACVKTTVRGKRGWKLNDSGFNAAKISLEG